MSTEAEGVTGTMNILGVVNTAKAAEKVEAEKRKDARVDALVCGWENLEKKIAAAEAEGPGSEWKVELHKQSIEVLKLSLKDLAK